MFLDFFKKTKKQQQPSLSQSTNTLSTTTMSAKETALYTKENIDRQRLYEKWIRKESWLLKTEAIPLLLGLDPERPPAEQIDDDLQLNLWAHAKKCVEKGLLTPVTNSNKQADEWSVSPAVIYRWASVSRIELPDAFAMLMEFVLTTVKQDNSRVDDTTQGHEQNSHDEATKLATDRERILGASLALLSACPERCKNRRGDVKSTKIMTLFGEYENVLFADERPDISSVLVKDVIECWLNKKI